MPSNTPSTDAVHQAASGSTQAANAPIGTRGSMSAMMQVAQIRTLVTPVVRSKAGGSVPGLNMPIGPGGLRETAQASTNPSPTIHGLPSEPLSSVQRPQTSIPPLPMMYSRMSAPVPHTLAASSEPIASTSSASKVKAPTISEIHVSPQWAIPRFSSLAPFHTAEWYQPLVSPGSIQEVVPHYWDKVAYVAKLLSLESLPHQRAMTDEWQSKLDTVVAERDQAHKCTLIHCAMWGY